MKGRRRGEMMLMGVDIMDEQPVLQRRIDARIAELRALLDQLDVYHHELRTLRDISRIYVMQSHAALGILRTRLERYHRHSATTSARGFRAPYDRDQHDLDLSCQYRDRLVRLPGMVLTIVPDESEPDPEALRRQHAADRLRFLQRLSPGG